ncbi:MAG: hypothetical protein ABSB11_04960 [Sedimentisphaerales bacterium]|jgi:hypothetical protein
MNETPRVSAWRAFEIVQEGGLMDGMNVVMIRYPTKGEQYNDV